MEKILVLHRKSLNFGKKIGKIVSRWALKSLKKDQISQKPRIINNEDIYVLYHWVLCFQKIYAAIGNNSWPRKKKIIYIFFKYFNSGRFPYIII